MEDTHVCKEDLFGDKKVSLYAVLDGHGGANAVQYVEKVLIKVFCDLYMQHRDNVKNIFKPLYAKIDAQLSLVGAGDQGTTICLAIVREEMSGKVCYVSNLGDTRAVLIDQGFKASRVTQDHKATEQSEIQRIQ